jgi:hypothetical protein
MAGALPYDHQLVRQAATLVRRLPVLDTPQFHEDYLTASPVPCSWKPQPLPASGTLILVVQLLALLLHAPHGLIVCLL